VWSIGGGFCVVMRRRFRERDVVGRCSGIDGNR
jgi:hypothetical protein